MTTPTLTSRLARLSPEGRIAWHVEAAGVRDRAVAAVVVSVVERRLAA